MRMLALLLATVLFSTSHMPANAETPKSPRADQPYIAERSDAIEHKIDFAVVVTPPYHCKVLKVWLPVPQSDQAQQISASRFSTFPIDVKPRREQEKKFGNEFAYFEFHNPRGAQIIRHQFSAKVWQLDWKMKADRMQTVDTWPADFQPYLLAQPIRQRDELDTVLAQLAPRRPGTVSDLFQTMGWIDANLEYDHVNASLQADANHALEKRRGHCSDYHGLCATMGRELGYPTRVTYGLALHPKNSPSHCKLEAYLPPYGWVSFDLSETQKLIGMIRAEKQLTDVEKAALIASATTRLHDGFRENSWLLLTRGTDYQLAPPAAKPVRVVRTIYAEADGEPLPEPDPASVDQRKFAWMTAHKYTANKPFKLPFKDWTTLDPPASKPDDGRP